MVDWRVWAVVFVLLAIVVLFFRRKIAVLSFGSFRPIRKRLITFASPHRVEMLLLLFYALFFLGFDIVKNTVTAFGVGHSNVFFGGITIPALDNAIIFLIAFHVILVSLFVRSILSRATHKSYDIFMGTFALFGVAILLAGFINELYSPTIRFLFIDMDSVSFYHIGVAFELIYALYLGFTK
jgi:hypothetical protein